MIEAVFGNLDLFILRFSCLVLSIAFFSFLYQAGKFAYEYYTCYIPAEVKKMLDDLGRVEEKVLSDAEKIDISGSPHIMIEHIVCLSAQHMINNHGDVIELINHDKDKDVAEWLIQYTRQAIREYEQRRHSFVKIESTEENWDNRVLGADERYVKVSGTEEVTL